jgi:hypothetical protein
VLVDYATIYSTHKHFVFIDIIVVIVVVGNQVDDTADYVTTYLLSHTSTSLVCMRVCNIP